MKYPKCILPALIMLGNPDRPKWTWPRVVEGTLLVAILAALAQMVFGGWIYARLGFLCAPPLLWAAFRLGRRGASLSVVFLSIFAIGGTLQGLGPFAGPDREAGSRSEAGCRQAGCRRCARDNRARRDVRRLPGASCRGSAGR